MENSQLQQTVLSIMENSKAKRMRVKSQPVHVTYADTLIQLLSVNQCVPHKRLRSMTFAPLTDTQSKLFVLFTWWPRSGQCRIRTHLNTKQATVRYPERTMLGLLREEATLLAPEFGALAVRVTMKRLAGDSARPEEWGVALRTASGEDIPHTIRVNVRQL